MLWSKKSHDLVLPERCSYLPKNFPSSVYVKLPSLPWVNYKLRFQQDAEK